MQHKMRGYLVLLALVGTSGCFAQSWEIGAAGGFGWYNDATITNAAGSSASAGFGPRFDVGGLVGEDVAEHFGGELRYTYRDGDSELRFNGREANLDAASHALHLDFLVYATGRH